MDNHHVRAPETRNGCRQRVGWDSTSTGVICPRSIQGNQCSLAVMRTPYVCTTCGCFPAMIESLHPSAMPCYAALQEELGFVVGLGHLLFFA